MKPIYLCPSGRRSASNAQDKRETVRLRQEVYDDVSARMLEEMADQIENQIPGIGSGPEHSDELKRRLHEAEAEASREVPRPQAQSFLTLLHGIDALTNSPDAEIATEVSRSVLRGQGGR